jgi:hypothetical protein
LRTTARHIRRLGPALAAAACLCLLAACAGGKPPADGPLASSALTHAGPPAPRDSDERLPNGETLRQFYAGVEGDLITSGRMRQEVDPADAPFTTDDLVRDFVNIGMKDEYVDMGGRYVQSETPALLRRWEKPVRVAVMNGPSSSPEDASRNRANVAAFTSRLAHLTGHDVAMGKGSDVNFVVLFMDSAERTQFADQVRAMYPDFAPAVIAALRDAPVNLFCITYAFFDPAAPSTYSSAIVLIRAEHPPLTRMSCVQEEMAQAMGLPNDSNEARPSLFNDTREFALLTEHDAILLRMLYDPRLRPGMTIDEVRPLLPAIAEQARLAQLRDEAVVTVAAN